MGMILKIVYLLSLFILGISFNANAKCAFNCTNNLGSNKGPPNFINKILKISKIVITTDIKSLIKNDTDREIFIRRPKKIGT